MDPTQPDLLTFEALIAAKARIDTLWNIFLAANLAVLGGLVLRPGYRLPELIFFAVAFALCLWINFNGLRDAYGFLEALFVAAEPWIARVEATEPAMRPLLAYVSDRSWGGSTAPWYDVNVLCYSRPRQIYLTHGVSLLFVLGLCKKLYMRGRQDEATAALRNRFTAMRAMRGHRGALCPCKGAAPCSGKAGGRQEP